MIINCNSIASKGPELDHLIQYVKPDFIICTETKLDSSIYISEFMPSGFTCFRKDRTRNGGGVMVAIRSCYPASEVEINADCENIWVSVSLRNGRKVVIGSFYRPPNLGVEPLEHLQVALDSIKQQFRSSNKVLILGGDFNAPNINWLTSSVIPSCPNKAVHEKLLELLADNHLSQMQKAPTRQANVLDLYCTDKPGLVRYTETIPGISDHEIVVTDAALRPEIIKKTPRKVFVYKKANWSAIKTELDKFSIEFTRSVGERSVEENWLKFKNVLQGLVDKYIPSRMTSCRHHLPWITPTIRRLCRKKCRLYNLARKSGKDKHWSNYKECKQQVRNALRNAHDDYINRILSEGLAQNDSKKFWKYIKAKKQDSLGVSPIKQNGTLHSDNKTKAELLSNQFKSVFTPKSNNNLPSMNGAPYPTIAPLNITEPGVKKLLQNIKVNKASGPDNLPARILKELAPNISGCLTQIFRQSLSTGTLPKDWKVAQIAPIFKKGNRHLPENYRPVSLTSLCAKIMEHILCHHIRNHLDKYKILTKCQHGFRAYHSCESQLITSTQDLLMSIENKIQTDVLVLDLAKAFDKVPHDMVLHKASHYGLRGEILLWLKDFLIGRSQSVVVDGIHSTSVEVTSGVPQGTVLGPTLFLIHINDLPESVSSTTRLFADDCILYRQIVSDNDHVVLQEDLNKLSSWASRWGMKFNATKCEAMSVGPLRTSYTYKLEGYALNVVNFTKYLGITIADDLSWSQHVNNITAKANSKIGLLWRNLKNCPRKIKEQAYFSLVRSGLEYSSTVWDPYLKKDVQKIEQVQRRAARFVSGDYGPRSSVKELINLLHWESLAKRRERSRSKMLAKILSETIAIDGSLLQRADDRTRANHDKKLKNVYARSTQYKQSFFPRTIPSWNLLTQKDVDAMLEKPPDPPNFD